MLVPKNIPVVYLRQDLEINLMADFEGRGHSKMQGVDGWAMGWMGHGPWMEPVDHRILMWMNDG